MMWSSSGFIVVPLDQRRKTMIITNQCSETQVGRVAIMRSRSCYLDQHPAKKMLSYPLEDVHLLLLCVIGTNIHLSWTFSTIIHNMYHHVSMFALVCSVMYGFSDAMCSRPPNPSLTNQLSQSQARCGPPHWEEPLTNAHQRQGQWQPEITSPAIKRRQQGIWSYWNY